MKRLIPILAGLAGLLLHAPALSQLAQENSPHVHVAPGFDGATAIAAGDLDGDGDVDTLVGTGQGTPCLIALNNGHDVFEREEINRLPGSFGSVHDVVLGDWDSDGDLDAMVTVDLGAVLWTNDGTGTFTDASGNLPAIPRRTYFQMAVGDVDGDGNQDVVGAATGGQDFLLLGDGNGGFSDGTSNLPVSQDPTFGAALGDIDGDGDLDLITAHRGRIGASTNNGAGVFTDETATRMPATSGAFYAVDLADLDGNGALDVVGVKGGSSGDVNLWYTNDGAGVFTEVDQTPQDRDDSVHLVLKDLNGDGHPDTVVGSNNRTVRVYLTEVTGGVVRIVQGPDTDLSRFWGFGPFDFIPLEDNSWFAAGSGPATTMHYLPFPLLGRGFQLGNAPTKEDQGRTFQLGEAEKADLNGDGLADIYITNEYTDYDVVYLTRPGKDPERFEVPTLDAGSRLTLRDMDLDGDVDVLRTSTQGFLQVGLNDGTGLQYQWHELLGTSDISLRDNGVGDINGDGKLDVIIVRWGSPTNVAFYDPSTNTFPETAAFRTSDTTKTNSVTIEDVNKDGFDDILESNEGQNKIYMGGPNGITPGTGRLPADDDASQGMILEDVDGDGDRDIFVINGNSFWPWRQDRLYLNDGTGFFEDATARSLPQRNDVSTGATFFDATGDGVMDLIVAHPFGDMEYLINDGTGVFDPDTGLWADAPAFNARQPMAIDFDADGDEDVCAFGIGSINWITNMEKHIRCPYLPRLGHPLVYEFYNAVPGQGDRLYLPAISFAAAPQPVVFPFGTIYLDMASLIPLPMQVVPSGGVNTFTFDVPDDPIHLGTELLVQCLEMDPNDLSSAEATKVLIDEVIR